ncbi:cyclin [Penicillium argentinense]|uniref:Cyclin n=1 Tax=Penicillium argentinense TaxID=1131581 RepID=A0A9W9FCZ4_9EURO|nr:cyclin [Penicillium argentinense]KAJ5097955.1 cyclin [Penicillium argentinense]
MECAGRALGFWAYQSTQEMYVRGVVTVFLTAADFLVRFYQEFLGKSLTEKYASLNTEMDKIIHNANSEIATLHGKVSDLQAASEELEKKNQELIGLNREKSKKLSQMTNLYNLLKARAMRTQLQSAASDTVSQTINTFSTRTEPTASISLTGNNGQLKSRTPGAHKAAVFPVSPEGVEQLHRYQRSGTGSSRQVGKITPGGTAMAPKTGKSSSKQPYGE